MVSDHLSAERLFKNIIDMPAAEWNRISVTGVVSDSRDVEAGNVYVAVKGFQTDGHGYIDEAIRNGASLVVVQDPVEMDGFPLIRVEDTRQTLALLAGRFYGDPSHDLHMIGITGTNGKTTVALLIEAILAQAGVECGLLGTMLYRWPGFETRAERTTPDAVELQRFLSTMRTQGVQSVVMEVTSHALALHRVTGMHFDIVLFTNLSRDHLDFHESFEAYRDVKTRLFGMMKSGGIAIVNSDDPASRFMLNRATGKRVTFGYQNPTVDYRVNGIVREGEETSFTITRRKHEMKWVTSLQGQFNVMNAAAAAVVGLEMELDEDVIFQALRSVKAVRGRMEGFVSASGIRVIVDYAHTPDALHRVLETVRTFTPGRIIVVFGCGGERDRGKRPQMGAIAEASADLVVVTSDNPRRDDPERIIEDILEGMKNQATVSVIADRKKAILRALEQAESGDTVVLAGKGHEKVQVIGTQGRPFDDLAVARAVLDDLEKRL